MTTTAKAVLIQENTVTEIDIDARPMSTYTHDALGGTPTFIGAWSIGEGEDMAYMMSLREPDESMPRVHPSLIPMIRHEVRGPVLVTALNSSIEPIDFCKEMLWTLD